MDVFAGRVVLGCSHPESLAPTSRAAVRPAPSQPAPCPPTCRSCSVSGGHSDDGYDVQPARVALTLRGAGTVLCYCSHAPSGVAVGGQQVPFSYDGERAALTFKLISAKGLPAGGTSECAVQF